MSRHQSRRGIATATLLGMLATLAPPAHAESFGRLFHTPAQRVELEQEAPRPAVRIAAPPPIAPIAPVRIDGILRRSDGSDTIWLNGEMRALPNGLKLPAGRRRELIPASAPHVRLRVGDSWPVTQGGAPTGPAIPIDQAASAAP
jgi:hypothetical protein